VSTVSDVATMVNQTRGGRNGRVERENYREEVVIPIILKDGGNLRLRDHIVQG